MNLWQTYVRDCEVTLLALFTQNFRDKGFFGRPWKPRLRMGGAGTEPSNLIQTGHLRRSLSTLASGGRIEFVSHAPYAWIHNWGGRIKVDPARYPRQWAFSLAMAGKYPPGKGGKRGKRLGAIGRMLIAKALRGGYIEIPRRQFIGDDPAVDAAIGKCSDNFFSSALPKLRK